MLVRQATREDADAIAAVQVRAWQSTYGNFIPEDCMESVVSIERAWDRWHKILDKDGSTNHVYVGLNAENKVVGFVSGGKNRSEPAGFDAEMYALYILKEEQGKGMGKALTREFVRHLDGEGFKSMVAWVFPFNPYRRFYEKLGGELLGQVQNVELGDRTFPSIGYGWGNFEAIKKAT